MHTLLGKRSYLFFIVVLFSVLGLFIFSVSASTTSLLPTADGNYTQWTPSTGTSHFALVDESACNGTTDYNSTTVVGNRDSYVIGTSSIPNGSTITQIDTKPCASRSGTGTGTSVMNVFYRFGGVNSSDAGSYSFTSGNTPADQATTSFNGLSLLQTSTTTLEVGAVLTSGNKGLRLSRVAVVVTYTPLSAPTSLGTTATTSSAIGLTWVDNSSTETGFAIDRSLNGVTWSAIASTSANATSYYDSGLTASTSYSYRVRAFNFGGYSGYSNVPTSSTLPAPPAAPSGLGATASTTQPKIALTWVDNSSDESNFEILRGTDGVNFSHLSTTSANVSSSTDSGLAPLTTYYYEVRAYNSGGYSAVSASASASTNDVPVSASGLSAVASSTALRIDLVWTDNASNEVSYSVERSSISSTTGFVFIKRVGMNTTSTTDTNMSASTTYFYRVFAVNGYGTSTASNVSSAMSASVPAAPSALAATASTTQPKIVLNWTDNSSNEMNFEILRSTNGINFSHLSTTSANVIMFTDSGLASLTTYYYKVRSFNTLGFSTTTSTTSTTFNVPSAASALSATASTSTLSIALSWADNSSNELSFVIERSISSTSGYATLATRGSNVTAYTDDTIASTTLYFYRVTAANGYGTSTASNVASAGVDNPNIGIVSYWRLDESSGDALDSVGTNTLTNTNVTYTAGKINNAASFDRSSTKLQISDASQSGLDIPGDISISTWVKIATPPGPWATPHDYPLVQKGELAGVGAQRSYDFVYQDDSGGTGGNALTIFLYGNADQSNASRIRWVASTYPSVDLGTSTWHHLVVSCVTANPLASKCTLYVDGTSLGNGNSNTEAGSGATSIYNSNAPLTIGTEPLMTTGENYETVDGLIDEVGIWGRALSSTEVNLLYNSGTGASYPF